MFGPRLQHRQVSYALKGFVFDGNKPAALRLALLELQLLLKKQIVKLILKLKRFELKLRCRSKFRLQHHFELKRIRWLTLMQLRQLKRMPLIVKLTLMMTHFVSHHR